MSEKNNSDKGGKHIERPVPAKDRKEGNNNGRDKKEGNNENSNDGDVDNTKADTPKAKIFDKDNFVEAPLPKTNPWKAAGSNAPVAVTPGLIYSCLFVLKF